MLIILLILLSLVLRIICIPHTNYDMTAHNVPWYMILYQNGIAKSMATEFANYSPPYTYFLALSTFTHDFIPPLTAIKLIPICFDVLGAFFIYRIVKIKYKQGYPPALAAAIYLTAPDCFSKQRELGAGRFDLHLLFTRVPVFCNDRKTFYFHAVSRTGLFH